MARRRKRRYRSRRRRKRRKKHSRSFWFVLPVIILVLIYLIHLGLAKFSGDKDIDVIESIADVVGAEMSDNIVEEISGDVEPEDFMKALPVSKKYKVQVIRHKTYVLGYSEKHEQALWVQYILTREQVMNKRVERYKHFEEDPLVITGSATTYDYSRSGYDRGHLLPSADRRYSWEAQKETFYMSNISPQYHNFNAKIWNNLEMKVRDWAVKERKLLVITGPAFIRTIDVIGKENKIPVPSHYYKIVIDLTPPYKSIAFLIPHTNRSETKFFKYKTTIDNIEEKIYIDFLAALPDSLENVLESRTYFWR